MKTRFRSFFLPGILLLALVSCKKDNGNDNTIAIVNKNIYDLMKEVYLWNTYLPASIDPSAYSTPVDFIDALRYSTYDRWSTVLTKEEFNQYFVDATLIGHGFMLGLDESNNLRIAFLYPTTQAYAQGVRRGWIVTKVNGTVATPDNIFTLLGASEVGITNSITFIDNSGATVVKSLTKEQVNISPVVYHKVFTQGSDKIGYFVFQDFIDAANTQLDAVFDTFRTAGVNEVIIDMRYNGGGSVDVAEHLASWLIGKDFGNQPFIKYQHNLNLAGTEDTTINLQPNPSGMSLGRIFFIGTSNTASASELVINGVKPYVESILAGTATHGKPVGMYAFQFTNYDYVVLPICFKYSNADNEGDFYNGLQPMLPANDDLSKDFGDPDEASLRAALDYIQTGAVPLKSITRTSAGRVKLIEPGKPINQYLKAY